MIIQFITQIAHRQPQNKQSFLNHPSLEQQTLNQGGDTKSAPERYSGHWQDAEAGHCQGNRRWRFNTDPPHGLCRPDIDHRALEVYQPIALWSVSWGDQKPGLDRKRTESKNLDSVLLPGCPSATYAKRDSDHHIVMTAIAEALPGSSSRSAVLTRLIAC